MPQLKSENRFEKLCQQEEELLEKLKQLKKKKSVASKQAAHDKRKQDTRRKLLIGAAWLNELDRGEWTEQEMLELMDRFLTRKQDRELFDLPEKETPKPKESVKSPPPLSKIGATDLDISLKGLEGEDNVRTKAS